MLVFLRASWAQAHLLQNHRCATEKCRFRGSWMKLLRAGPRHVKFENYNHSQL